MVDWAVYTPVGLTDKKSMFLYCSPFKALANISLKAFYLIEYSKKLISNLFFQKKLLLLHYIKLRIIMDSKHF